MVLPDIQAYSSRRKNCTVGLRFAQMASVNKTSRSGSPTILNINRRRYFSLLLLLFSSTSIIVRVLLTSIHVMVLNSLSQFRTSLVFMSYCKSLVQEAWRLSESCRQVKILPFTWAPLATDANLGMLKPVQKQSSPNSTQNQWPSGHQAKPVNYSKLLSMKLGKGINWDCKWQYS